MVLAAFTQVDCHYWCKRRAWIQTQHGYVHIFAIDTGARHQNASTYGLHPTSYIHTKSNKGGGWAGEWRLSKPSTARRFQESVNVEGSRTCIQVCPCACAWLTPTAWDGMSLVPTSGPIFNGGGPALLICKGPSQNPARENMTSDESPEP